MEMTFTWYIDIDVCSHVLQIGVEEYTAQFSLLNFPFSKGPINAKTLVKIEIINYFNQEPFHYVILFFLGKPQSFVLSGVYRIKYVKLIIVDYKKISC